MNVADVLVRSEKPCKKKKTKQKNMFYNVMPQPLLILHLSYRSLSHYVAISAVNSAGECHYVLMCLAVMWLCHRAIKILNQIDVVGLTCAKTIQGHVSATC